MYTAPLNKYLEVCNTYPHIPQHNFNLNLIYQTLTNVISRLNTLEYHIKKTLKNKPITTQNLEEKEPYSNTNSYKLTNSPY